MDLQELSNEIMQKTFAPLVEKAANSGKISIFGAGQIGLFLKMLADEKKLPLVSFIDDYSTFQEIDGLKVCKTTETISELAPDTVLVASITSSERIKNHLLNNGFQGRILCLEDPIKSDMPNGIHTYQASPSEKITRYKDLHKGKRAFIIGNGPSLKNTSPLRLNDEITFACNSIFYYEGFKPSYYVVEDYLVAQDRMQEIRMLPWEKIFPCTLYYINQGTFLPALPSSWPGHFSKDISKWIEVNFTVTYTMMQIAYYMGCNPVYIIGIDHNYSVDTANQCIQEGNLLTSVKDDPNHFDSRYFGKGKRWHTPRVDRMEAAYHIAKKAYEDDGRKIFNATAGGKLEVFPRVNFESLFGNDI